MRALETCYIRLCHKAELCTAVNTANPKHPHAPHVPSESPHVQPNLFVVSPQLECDPNSSTSDLIFPLSPDPSQAQFLHADTQTAAASAAAAGAASLTDAAAAPHAAQKLDLSDFNYCCFHSPFHKLVRKAFARLCHIDKLRQQRPADPHAAGHSASTHASKTSSTAEAETQQDTHPQEVQAHQDALQQAHPQHTHSLSQLQHPHEQHSPSTLYELYQQQCHHQQAPDLQQQQQHQPEQQLQRLHQLQEAEAAELHTQLADTLSNRALEKAMANESAAQFEAKVQPGCLAGQALGNMYSGVSSQLNYMQTTRTRAGIKCQLAALYSITLCQQTAERKLHTLASTDSCVFLACIVSLLQGIDSVNVWVCDIAFALLHWFAPQHCMIYVASFAHMCCQ